VHIVVTVSNDLATDQRVQRVCSTLALQGFDVLLLGRKLPNSLPFEPSNFKARRFSLLFNSGPLFYLALNVRLFFTLLFAPCSIIHANDLDTLLPAWLVAKIRRKHLVYDTHEYFTGVPELQLRPGVKAIWKAIESFVFPRLKHVFTVNESIANLYRNDYGNTQIQVMRNIPPISISLQSSADFLAFLPPNRFKIILQGNGINVDRGGEEAVQMMQFLPDSVLIIAGSGDVIPKLKEMVRNLQLQDRVVFFDRMPYERLLGLTSACDLGLSLDKDSNVNYRFSLPNKIFDYLRAGIPVLASNLTEVRRIVDSYGTGWIATDLKPEALAEQITWIKKNTEAFLQLKSELHLASSELCWENECKPLVLLYNSFRF
jgi:glycosyltransferase involved in cell wall biosynthesis